MKRIVFLPCVNISDHFTSWQQLSGGWTGTGYLEKSELLWESFLFRHFSFKYPSNLSFLCCLLHWHQLQSLNKLYIPERRISFSEVNSVWNLPRASAPATYVSAVFHWFLSDYFVSSGFLSHWGRMFCARTHRITLLKEWATFVLLLAVYD